MQKKGHNKAHRYDLNQISYYIEANEDYIPYFGDSYHGNMHDSKTFGTMVDAIPESSILILDRGYNSSKDIQKIRNRKYTGALVQSDYMGISVKKDSFIETRKVVYGMDHRIIVYHSSKIGRKRIMAFRKTFRKAYVKVRGTMDSGDSDALVRERIYLKSIQLQEKILLHDVIIASEKMHSRLEMLRKLHCSQAYPIFREMR